MNVEQQNTKDEIAQKPCSSRNAVKVHDIKDASNSKKDLVEAEEIKRQKELTKEEETNNKKVLDKAEDTKRQKEVDKAEENKKQKELAKAEETTGYKKLKIRTDLIDLNAVKKFSITSVPHHDNSAFVKHKKDNIIRETVTQFEKQPEISHLNTALAASSVVTLVDPPIHTIKQEPTDADNDVIVDLVIYKRPGADLVLPAPSISSSSTSGDKQVNEPTWARARSDLVRIRPCEKITKSDI